MGAVRLFTSDLLRSTAAYIRSSTTGYATASRAVDGNPAAQWAAGATSANFIWYQSPGVVISGFAISNHNCAGASFVLSIASAEVGPWTAVNTGFAPATNDDFVYYPIGGLGASSTYFKLAITGAAANILIGEISFLADYGYNSAGAAISSGGAIHALANEAGFGVMEPIGRSIDSNIGEVFGATGIRRRTYRGSPEEVFTIRFAELRNGVDLEWWRLVRSYTWPTKTAKTNPRWKDGLWLTLPDYDSTSSELRRGYYVDIEGAGLMFDLDRTSRASGQLVFRERNRG